MKKILFGDDEQKIFDGLRGLRRPMLQEWEMAFVTSGEKALTALEQAPLCRMLAEALGMGRVFSEMRFLTSPLPDIGKDWNF